MTGSRALMLMIIAVSIPSIADGDVKPPGTAGIPSPSAFEFSTPVLSPDRETTIPVLLNNSVEAYIEYFRTERTMFQQGLNNAVPYIGLMKEIFRAEDLPDELVYVVMIESWFDHAAVSRKRAVGPWQFMPRTGLQYGLKNDQWVDERRDPIKSTLAAARYLRTLHTRLRSWPLVLAAYNAGIGTVRRAVAMARSEDFWDLKESLYLGKETKNFVPKIMAAAIIARDPAAYGFRMPVDKTLRFDIVFIARSARLSTLTGRINSTYRALKSLNPEIKGDCTPPRGYFLRIPAGTLLMSQNPLSPTASPTILSGAGHGEISPSETHENHPRARRNYHSVLFMADRKPRKIRGRSGKPATGNLPSDPARYGVYR